MADKASQLILSALSRAAAEPGGLSLHGAKGLVGLFPATPAGRQAAARCIADGHLRAVPARVPVLAGPADASTRKSKPEADAYELTDKGRAYLLREASPRTVLEDFVRVLETRHTQAADLVRVVRDLQTSFAGLKSSAEEVLQQVVGPEPAPATYTWPAEAEPRSPQPEADWTPAALAWLTRRQREAGASEDCPLPELYRQARASVPTLTLGRFHDGLRRLHAAGQLYLHPWTGPLYDLPEPACALLVGHEVAYYASTKPSVEF